MNKVKLLFIVAILSLLNACAVKKYMPENAYLYTKGTIDLQTEADLTNQKYLQQQVNEVLFPKPNSTSLWMRPGLHFYYKMQEEKPGFLSKFFYKQVGEDPVYFSDVDIENTKKIIRNRLENLGHFSSEISHKIKIDSSKRHKSISYQIQLKKAYTLNSFQLDSAQADSLAIFKDIQLAITNSLITKSSKFDLSKMKAERERIHSFLKEKGYYNFSSNFILFEADTNQYKNHKYDLYLRLKNEVPAEALIPYTIHQVDVYPNVSLNTETKNLKSTRLEGINFYQDSLYFKPKRLRPFILIEEGNVYQPSLSKNTSRRLGNLNTYKFVNIEYEEVDSLAQQNNRFLNAKIYLSPLNKRSLRFEIQAVTKSNNFAGPSLGLTYINRNLFKSGEELRLNASVGYERQFLGGNQDDLSSLQLGLRGNLSLPRLLFPIDVSSRFKYAVPKTNIGLGLDVLDRTNLYTLSSVNTSFGYSWEGNTYVNHSITPINLEYLSLQNTSNAFEEILENNPFLRRSFEQQFIAGLTYSFTYNAIPDQLKSDGVYFNFNFETAGNSIDFITGSGERPQTFLNLEYAQFVKADFDFRQHFAFNKHGNKLVTRLFAGVGLPYGNSTSLPFVKQYFSGGPYSVRGFGIRSLGPGVYEPEEGITSFFDQAGDIRLEANIEYRFPIFEYIYGAVFTDAGNVWLMNENPALPGGKFTSSFAEEFGFSSGLGLRVDITGFVIRFDLAAPLKNPAQNWNFEYDQPVLNFAIGYPF
ncbi:translocation and assembly module lipoprotein TamL [Psychroflexus salis]|uniref:Membrane protein n=1 Tax=Psychroflexus salis TaxID=1526574 RepID=A0A917E8Q1_9FLAO|nr:BamA/TamA family outer membrane protein [Psychroflexus salis]GGE11707.1 membrane protein [Psychroflexus salis]